MSSPLSAAIAGLSSRDSSLRQAAATEIYRAGRTPADRAVASWWRHRELNALFGPHPVVIVGLAVERETFALIRTANNVQSLAQVPAEQDAEEFELQFPDGVSLDVLTPRHVTGTGAVARYLSRFGEGVQQVEFRCTDVDRATEILKTDFHIAPIYPETRPGADGTRVNFFLLPVPSDLNNAKVLIEVFTVPQGSEPAQVSAI